MDILDAVFLNTDAAETEESDIGSDTVILSEANLNPDVEDEVAQVSEDEVEGSIVVDSHSTDHLTPLNFQRT